MIVVSKVRCATCSNYIDKDVARKVGIQHYCPDCKVRSGLKKKPPSNPMSTSLRKRVMEADGVQCRRCGKKSDLHVHHIKYRSSGGKHESDNLITLCGVCHAQVHSDKGKYQSLCFDIVQARETSGDKQTLIYQFEKRLRDD